MANAPKYLNSGNVGAMGDNARSDNNTFVQSASTGDIDLAELAAELGRVRTEMKRKADPADGDHDAEIGMIAQAEKAARAGDKSKALDFLKDAGKWTLDVAKSVAAEIVKDAIEGKIST